MTTPTIATATPFAPAWFPHVPNSFSPFSPVDIVREVYSRYARRDYARVFEMLSPEIEISQSPELPWGGKYLGLDGAQEFFSRLISHRDATPEPHTFIPSGNDVAVIGRLRGRIRPNGKSFDIDLVHLWTVRAGRVTHWAAFENTSVMKDALNDA